jgi:formylglycine-generating enzyme required for sulfatase activity
MASFDNPIGVAVSEGGDLFITDYGNHRIRKITGNGTVTTLAGSGSASYADGQGLTASFNNPIGVAVGGTGSIYVVDQRNHRIRKITHTGNTTTLSGSGSAAFSDGLGAVVSFQNPYGVAVDSFENLYVADSGNNRIRKITQTATGGNKFTIIARDSANPQNSVEREFTLSIASYGMTVSGPDSASGSQFSTLAPAQFAVTGGVAAYRWTATGLPASLSINSSTGLVSGNLTAAPGNYTANITVTDGKSQADSKNFTITIGSLAPLVATGPASISGERYQTISPAQFSATGGAGNYTWSTNPKLPASLSINTTTGLITGNLTTTPGTYPVTVIVKDRGNQTASINCTVTILAPPPLVVTGPANISGERYQPIAPAQFSVTGGVAPYKWSTSPSLPASLSINATTGVISGNLTAAPGNLTVAVTAKDKVNQTATHNCTITILAPGPLTITTDSNLGNTAVGQNFTTTLQATGGKPPYIWSFVFKGNLPANATLTANGTLTANSSIALSANFSVRVNDSLSANATKAMTLRFINSTPNDTDGDGVNDYRELYDGTDLTNATSFNPLSIGLVAHYPFDGNASDESGFYNDGIVKGAILVADEFGNPSSAYQFNGSNSSIEVPDSQSLRPLKQITLSAWMNLNVFQNYRRILTKGVNINDSFGSYQLTTGSNLNDHFHDEPLFTIQTANGYRVPDPKSGQPIQQWIQVVGTYDGEKARLFHNGKLVAEVESSGDLRYDANPLVIGRDLFYNKSFDGKIDEVRIYNRALSAAEVSHLYTEESGEPNMVLVQGGTLPAGSALANQTVSAFHIARFETTRVEWTSVVSWAKNHGYDLDYKPTSYPYHPIQSVNWYDAIKWCNAKSEMEGYAPVYISYGGVYRTGNVVPQIQSSANGYRLPNENEWEWAARGAQVGGNFTYSGSNSINDVGWYGLNAINPEFVFHQGDTTGIRPAGLKMANQLGIYDISGNIAEWCWEESVGNTRMVRGGHFRSSAEQCSVGWRGDYIHPDGSHSLGIVGFRYARNAIGDMVTVQGGTLPQSSQLAGQKVQAFQIGRAEVTWGEWKTVRTWAAANGYSDLATVGEGSADNHPLRNVNWYDAVKWLNAKSQMEGLVPVYSVNGTIYRAGSFGAIGSSAIQTSPTANGYRLPLEAEWEWAARGGVSSKGYTYSGGNSLDAIGWYWTNSIGASTNLSQTRGTWPVGLKGQNELGIFDMTGNVWERCEDKVSESVRRFRGGGWRDGVVSYSSLSSRDPANFYPVDTRYDDLGLRLARNIGPKISITGTLPEATLNQAYAGYTFGVVGSTGDKIWSISEGALPPGMSFSANGTLSGTPTTAGTYNFVIRLESGGYWDEVEVELEVSSSNGFQLSSPWTLRWSGNNTAGGNFLRAWVSQGLVWLPHYAIKYRSGKFLAGGIYSDDGLDWKTFTLPNNVNDWLNESGVAGNVFLLNGAGNDLWNSSNGTTWTKRSNSGGYDDLCGIEFGNGTVVVNRFWSPGSLLVSKDLGNTWSFVDTGSFNFAPGTDGRHYERTIFGNNKFLFPLYDSVRTSADGLTWQTTAVSNRPTGFTMAVISNFDTRTQKFMGVQQTGSNATTKTITTASSADGISWTFRASQIPTTNAAQFSGASIGEGFLVVSGGTPAEVWVSTNEGQSWFRASGPWEEAGVTGVAFAASPSRLIAATPSKIYSAELTQNPTMVTVQGGTLPANNDLFVPPREAQAVSTFQIGKYEVTWGEWQAVRNWAVRNGYTDLEGLGQGKGDNFPVENVNWFTVVKWCNAKSQMEGLTPVYEYNGDIYKNGIFYGSNSLTAVTANSTANGYRLPKDAEWEWAARGGISSQGYNFSGSNEVNSVAWYWGNAPLDSNGSRGASPVGQKTGNELGLYDMSGNVSEWCEDIVNGGPRRIRGGWYETDWGDVRVGNRSYGQFPGTGYPGYGFRLARTRYLMTLSELIATNPNYATAKDLAMIITPEQSRIFADTQNAYGDPRHVPSPVALSDGTFFLCADLLTEFGPNGLYRSWFQHLPQDIFPQIYIIPMAEAIELLPALEQIDDQLQ